MDYPGSRRCSRHVHQEKKGYTSLWDVWYYGQARPPIEASPYPDSATSRHKGWSCRSFPAPLAPERQGKAPEPHSLFIGAQAEALINSHFKWQWVTEPGVFYGHPLPAASGALAKGPAWSSANDRHDVCAAKRRLTPVLYRPAPPVPHRG